jgi:hypothetical protein
MSVILYTSPPEHQSLPGGDVGTFHGNVPHVTQVDAEVSITQMGIKITSGSSFVGIVVCWELAMECRNVGFVITTTQIILDNNLFTTLLTLAIQPVRVSSEVTL